MSLRRTFNALVFGGFIPILVSLAACSLPYSSRYGGTFGGASTILLGGKPATTAKQDVLYSFTPTASGSVDHYLAQNLPAWAKFDTKTGVLSGLPDNVGDYPNITISAFDAQGNFTTTAPFSIHVAGDPLTRQAWHLGNFGQTSFATYAGTKGEDLRVREALGLGVTGNGVKIWVSDTGSEIAHEDLTGNVIAGASKNYRQHLTAPYEGDPSPDATNLEDDHGTMVSGIMAAVGWNDVGSRGVAPGARYAAAKLVPEYDGDPDPSINQLVDAAKPASFDIMNQSWGYFDDGIVPPQMPNVMAALETAATTLRGGKGLVIVNAAGNGFFDTNYFDSSLNLSVFTSTGGNQNWHNMSPYGINVAAINAAGVKSSYSSSDASIWVSGTGGEYGGTFSVNDPYFQMPAIISTDQSGCGRGSARTGTLISLFNLGQDPGGFNKNCNYTNAMNGTSSAAPSVAGVAALMLEANPNLTWRDVKYILAATARMVDPNIPALSYPWHPTNYVSVPSWKKNAAGLPFHSWYGFGAVNAEMAVRMAKSYSSTWGSLKRREYDSGALNVAIPDFSAAGATNTVTVPAGDDMVIEAVTIEVSITHPFVGDLGIDLISPAQTSARLLDATNSARQRNIAGATLLANSFLLESAKGSWQIKVVDGSRESTGSLTHWKLILWGH